MVCHSDALPRASPEPGKSEPQNVETQSTSMGPGRRFVASLDQAAIHQETNWESPRLSCWGLTYLRIRVYNTRLRRYSWLIHARIHTQRLYIQYIYIHIYTYIYIYMCAAKKTYIHTYIHMHVCLHACISIHIYTHLLRVHILIHAIMYIWSCVRLCIQTD